MADFIFIASHERGALTDYYISIGGNASRNTTTPITGAAHLRLAYPSGSTTWNTQLQTNWVTSTGTTNRKFSAHFRFKFSALPTANAVLFNIGSIKVYINTAGKIRYDTTDSTMAAMSINTEYECEVLYEPDTGGPEGTGVTIRIDGVEVISNGASGSVSLYFGENNTKAATGPATNIDIDDVVMWLSNTTIKYAPWLNSQVPQTIRVPIANSATYNEFKGISEATNKYLNIDEDPHSATDYNNDGAIGVTRRQAFTFTNVASYVDTIRGFTIHHLGKGSGGDINGLSKLIRQSSTDYTVTSNITSAGLTPDPIGYPTNLDGTALTAAGLNALEAGYQIALSDTAYDTISYSNILPTADGSLDGVFTQTGGTAGSAYTAVDEVDGAPNNADYITSAAAGERQGFTLSFVPGTSNIGDTIYKVSLILYGRTNAASGSASQVKIGVRIGGVNYDGSNTQAFAVSTTDFNRYAVELIFSGSYKNPATGNRFTQAELNGGVEFYVKHETLGAGSIDVTLFNMRVYSAGNVRQEAMFMEVITGDAFTDNGNRKPTQYLKQYNQTINRSNTF